MLFTLLYDFFIGFWEDAIMDFILGFSETQKFGCDGWDVVDRFGDSYDCVIFS